MKRFASLSIPIFAMVVALVAPIAPAAAATSISDVIVRNNSDSPVAYVVHFKDSSEGGCLKPKGQIARAFKSTVGTLITQVTLKFYVSEGQDPSNECSGLLRRPQVLKYFWPKTTYVVTGSKSTKFDVTVQH